MCMNTPSQIKVLYLPLFLTSKKVDCILKNEIITLNFPVFNSNEDKLQWIARLELIWGCTVQVKQNNIREFCRSKANTLIVMLKHDKEIKKL